MPAAGVSLSEVSVTPASVSHGLPAINVCFGMAPRVYVPMWPGGGGGPLLWSPSLLSSPPLPPFPPSCPPTSLPQSCCLPEVPRGISLSCQSGNLLRNTHFISCISFTNSLPHSLYGASGNFLRDELPAPKPLSSGLLPGNLCLDLQIVTWRPAHVPHSPVPPFSS